MAEMHVVSALRNERAELAGMVGQLEQQLARQRTNLAHLDATMRLLDPDIRSQEIRAKQQRARSAWFRQGECLRRIHDELRNAAQPLTTRDLAERIMRAKAVPASDDCSRELIQKAVLGLLNRVKETIARVEATRVVSWRLVQAARARCQMSDPPVRSECDRSRRPDLRNAEPARSGPVKQGRRPPCQPLALDRTEHVGNIPLAGESITGAVSVTPAVYPIYWWQNRDCCRRTHPRLPAGRRGAVRSVPRPADRGWPLGR
jgi:hypothetical protein